MRGDRPKGYRPFKRVSVSAVRRPQSHKRGYGHDWRRLRRVHLSQHPRCQDCRVKRRTKVAVDHVIPIRGEDDPLRLDERNLRTRCHTHHSVKTRMYDKAIRREFDVMSAVLGYDEAVERCVARWAGIIDETQVRIRSGLPPEPPPCS